MENAHTFDHTSDSFHIQNIINHETSLISISLCLSLSSSFSRFFPLMMADFSIQVDSKWCGNRFSLSSFKNMYFVRIDVKLNIHECSSMNLMFLWIAQIRMKYANKKSTEQDIVIFS